jgi:Rieske Fe-S protein
MKRKNPWSVLFDPQRINPLVSAKKFIGENINAVSCLIGDRLKHRDRKGANGLFPGEGKILKVQGKELACYKDEAGKVYQVSPVCTHIGCIVHFNDAEKTWDCPCHGSRFNYDGKVIHGPAAKDLKAKD